MNGTQATAASILCWPKRLLSADDLRRHLTSQRELVLLPKTLITPLAADELRARGVRVRWEASNPIAGVAAEKDAWFYAQEKQDALIASAVQALERDGFQFSMLEGSPRTLAETLVASYAGGIVFCGDAATAACIANKIAGVRAAAVVNVAQTMRAKKKLGANLYAIEVPGPTFFEIRQMLKIIVVDAGRCPEDVATTLKELDGHAHR